MSEEGVGGGGGLFIGRVRQRAGQGGERGRGAGQVISPLAAFRRVSL